VRLVRDLVYILVNVVHCDAHVKLTVVRQLETFDIDILANVVHCEVGLGASLPTWS